MRQVDRLKCLSKAVFILAKMEGWIKIHRRLLDWEWYDDNNVIRVFLHLLLTANFETKRWRGIVIERGQLVTSINELANDTNLTPKQTRTALEKLKSTNEIDTKGANKYTLITICKYDTYQGCESAEGQTKGEQTANKGQTKGNQRATTKEYKEYKNEIMEEIIDCADAQTKTKKATKKKYGEFENVLLTDEEAQKLHNEFGNDAIGIVDFLSSYRAEKGYKNKSDYLSIKRWVANAYFEQLNKTNNGNNGTSNRSIQERAERIAEYAFAANGLQNG